MYSHLEEVQIVVAGLKAYGIREVVMAPGGSDMPIMHSVETDPFFRCHSVVDERSLVYFAMGLAQEKGETVACVCTSGTAVANFLPGIVEAHYQDVPLVAITADKNPRYLDQLETQKIDQRNIFGDWVKCSVDMPVVQSRADHVLGMRLVKTALAEVRHHGIGPVHINVPIVGNDAVYDVRELPQCEPYIFETPQTFLEDGWVSYAKRLEGKKVLLVIGQNVSFSSEDAQAVDVFANEWDCAVAVEHLSNLKLDRSFNMYPVSEVCASVLGKEFLPDVVVSVGNNYASSAVKLFLRKNRSAIEHWAVSESGIPRDTYDALRVVFECSPSFFFAHFPRGERGSASTGYFDLWKAKRLGVSFGDIPLSGLYVGKTLAKSIPRGSILHLAVLNSIRVVQLFELDECVKTYANVGALGIDGCLSSFLGQAAASTDKLAYCLIGDLSFFYDMNAASLRDVGNNVRIIMLNNGGGSEFHYYMGERNVPTIDNYICARNGRVAKEWVESVGFSYRSARSKEEVDAGLEALSKPSEAPLFLEVFTDMRDDAEVLREAYKKASPTDLKTSVKNAAKSVLSPKQIGSIKRLLG
ncbi:MAG TPA: 2-succinyl-5-enolpyruvyl-6-hydroxy-3-cyclohexene-1-carboxylic-acid synthase [Candidatus Rubneribacter avistercoris]|nr:2-succinyl-5-enolpyruvyl-6-hydroxy-3-cyclohexene-1-carboxylic-acid synthase [Candidatus Rubneribacter avistercoris]